jgi:hypothetical protein
VISWVLCAALLAAPVEPQDAALAGQVETLVRRLDALTLTERDAAERELLELGARVLPLLPAIDDRVSAEAAKRVTRLRSELLRAQAAAAAEPSLVTLKGRDLPLEKVLESIREQTGNEVVDHRAAFGQAADAVRLDVDFDKRPFWPALDSLLDQAGLTVYGFTGQRGVFLVSQPQGAGTRAARASYAGMFRMEPVRFEAQRDLRNDQAGSLRFFMELSWEPRLQPFTILERLSDVSATGAGGRSIAVANPQAVTETLIRRGFSSTEIEVPFELPRRDTATIASLRGKLVALVPGPLEEFRFEQLPLEAAGARPKPVEQRKAGTLVTLQGVRQNNDIWAAAVRVRFEAPETALESHRGWMLENEAFFEDAQGKRIDAGGLEQTLQAKDEIGINYLFDLPEGPQKLTFVYRTPLVVLELPVEYEFRDLPLP